MKISIRTKVKQDFKRVFADFNRTLFLKLAPPFPKLKLLRFDGCRKGDLVEVELNTGIGKKRWTSLITDFRQNEYEIYFIDQGQELPSPLTFWKHKHVITKNGDNAIIRDLIEYSTGSRWLDLLLYPIMYAQFLYRRPIYKRMFGS